MSQGIHYCISVASYLELCTNLLQILGTFQGYYHSALQTMGVNNYTNADVY